MGNYIGKYSTSGDVQTAVDNGVLLKPYVALVGDEIDFNSYTAPLTYKLLQSNTLYFASPWGQNILTIEYRVNGGNWTSVTSKGGSGQKIGDFNEGDVIQFRGNNGHYGIHYNATYMATQITGNGNPIQVYGNIMSLIDSTGYTTATTLTDSLAFAGFFRSVGGVTDVSGLVLPATTLTDSCYAFMFYECRALTTAPELPATTLVDGCYDSMFQGCTSLTTAPELPATNLATYCYQGMFGNCSRLKYVKCLATDISASSCTAYWVNGVASTGTFVTPSTTNWTTGKNGIPTNWTRVNS